MQKTTLGKVDAGVSHPVLGAEEDNIARLEVLPRDALAQSGLFGRGAWQRQRKPVGKYVLHQR